MLTAAPMPAAYSLRRQHFGLRSTYNFIQYLWIITLTLDYYVLSALNTFGWRILTASIVIRFVQSGFHSPPLFVGLGPMLTAPPTAYSRRQLLGLRSNCVSRSRVFVNEIAAVGLLRYRGKGAGALARSRQVRASVYKHDLNSKD